MKKNQRISIKDISKELGLSITTISFIINKKAKNKISPEVIKRVEDYVEKVGYKPNSSAQALRTGKSKTIVFMAEDISDPFFSLIAKEMEEIAFLNGYKIIYCSTENDKNRALELLQLFKDRQVDAFIITPPEDFEKEVFDLLRDQEQVVMLFDRRYHNLNHSYVVLDNFDSAQSAVNFYFKEGYKHVAFVGLDSDISALVERHNGYLHAIEKHGADDYSLLLPFKEVKTKAGNQILIDFLSAHPSIDAIIFGTNGLAINGLKALNILSKKIPEDIAVITFDDRDVFELYTPTISVVSQPMSDLANELIKGTLQLLNSEKKSKQLYQKVLKGTLVLRKSTIRVKD